MFRDLVLRNRSYRRFFEDQPVPAETLRDLVDLARQTPSGANRQGLKYRLSCTPESNAIIFSHLAWAGYLGDWPGPPPGERPSAYVLLLCDHDITKDVGCDHGIAAQTLLLGAVERGLGGCMIGNIQREPLLRKLGLDPERFTLLLAVALGRPKESVVMEPVGPEGDIKYYRDAQGVHHVPKRSLEEVLLPE